MTVGTGTILDQTTRREQANPWVGSDYKVAFVVWGPPSHGPRSQVLARELGIKSVHFVRAGGRRGILSAPFRYAYQAFKMLKQLLRDRPDVVFVQSPPSLAVLVACLYGWLTGAQYLIDAHSAALLQRVWMWPRWLHRLLVRRAITTMVTNDHFMAMIRDEGGHAFLLPDIPTQFGKPGDYPLNGAFKVAIVNTFSQDEPLPAMLVAAKELPEIDFYVTGDKKRASAEMLALAPANVHFTGFLPDTSYYGLLGSADAVMCLTTREHTMQRGACEALSLGKPIITSDTRLLRSYFDRGSVHVASESKAIREGISRLKADLGRYQVEIQDLQAVRRREWLEKKQALAARVQQAIAIHRER